MTSWNAGYVTDITYTHGYYSELNSVCLKLAMASRALAFTKIRRVCELGFGQGVSIAMHAAAQAGTEYWGTDFNPAQAAHARSLVEAAGVDCYLFDQSFEEFCGRDDLPEFDFISLHGIWSWISDHNRSVIVDFIRRKLKVGGLLYVSYNTLPGWAAALPMRHMLTQYANKLGAPGQGMVGRVKESLGFFQKMLEVDPAYIRANPNVKARFEKLSKQNPSYLAHEYFNLDWEPMHFATMEEWLSSAKMNYACSAHFVDHVEALNLSGEQMQFLKTIPDMNLREGVRDFMVNQQFRRDFWVKGLNSVTKVINHEERRALRFVMIQPLDQVDLRVMGAKGEAEMHKDFYEPILNCMADYKIRSLGDIIQAISSNNEVDLHRYFEAMLLMVSKGILALAQSDEAVSQARGATDRLNLHVVKMARGDTAISHLASPVTGGAIPAGRVEQLFLLAILQGAKNSTEISSFVWSMFKLSGTKLLKDGVPIETEESNREHLTELTLEFLRTRLVVLERLGIIDAPQLH